MSNPNDGENNCMADNESNIAHNNGIEDPECQVQQNVSATPNIPGLVWPTWKSKRQAEEVFVMVNAMETWRNTGVQKK